MASEDTLIPLSAGQGISALTAGATPFERNNRPVFQFSASVAQTLEFPGLIMPSNYSATTGIDVKMTFTAVATTGDVDVDVALERNDGAFDLDGNGFATAVSVDNTNVPATSGFPFAIIVALLTSEMDGVIKGDMFRMSIARPNSDTASGFLELHNVEILET